MLHTFLWNVRMWLKGIMLLLMFPLVVVWKVVVDFPIAWAQEFESERED